MLDLRWLRENPDQFDTALARRGMPAAADPIVQLDQQRRSLETKVQEDQALRNRLSKEAGRQRGPDGKPPRELLDQMAQLKDSLKAREVELRDVQEKLDQTLIEFPNILADDVPDGPDETHNVELRRWGDFPSFDFEPRDHLDVGTNLGLDMERAAKMSGARFFVLHGPLARLQRAIYSFYLDLQTLEHGYSETLVPLIVRESTLYNTAQLPKMREDLFRLEDGRFLIPTSEVALANLAADQIIDEATLPLRFTANTPCFRSEAGAAGKDTKGIIRVHQFYKVELVSVTRPEQSVDEHERMTACAEEGLKRLNLPYRVVVLCSGDTGFGARKTYDIEVWLPSQQHYREISSCSNCGDFQARRMNARCRPAGEKQTRFVHTLNGSGLAVGRTLVAIMENYQNRDGSVTVPEALRPYMAGIERIEPHG